METILSAIVFVYAMEEAVEILKRFSDDDFLRLDVLACTGCAMWCAVYTGMSRTFCTSRVEEAVDSIESIHAGGINRLGPVDLFEYNEVFTVGLRIWEVVSVWILFQVLFLMSMLFLASFAAVYFLGYLWLFVVGFLLLSLIYFTYLLCGLSYYILKSGEECGTQPLCFRARAMLLAFSMMHAVLL